MEFKIDTKPTYTVIAPETNILDANLTAAIRQKWKELTEKGSHNLIVDLHNCLAADENSTDTLVAFHEEVYNNNESLVFTNLKQDVINALKNKEADLIMNVAPTMKEAVDIVSMEILERELFDEGS